ncbi:MurR/RpiR family transcriptional regulator [Kaistia dalseonensis]|uniref:DNA-binding MurR/RpiR family transcriptional regulator n=1 Tax=Kaistia dalseonensis TaxID=410840 RepID=A0ABU0H2R3_9HYPH|nr:MurR/RpiR family transcriptional regulator [Kaistia dalseonensis]MCX5494017.1 MurR/RpiR family transcriptional regulator [Kaistia dalseonensis]MDQ0436594.1 DNA-binding MurR/RpiR family transcriptional regulator [Kaistia dalseonensis]
MGTLLSLRIQERFEQLTPSEQRLAAVLLDRSDEILTFSATELAQFSGVSKATAARLFRSLGYSDFNEVRLQAREERNRTGPTQNIVVSMERPTGASTVSGHLQSEIASLTRTFEFLRSDLLAEVAEHLASARRIWIAGSGPHSGSARLARSLFAQVRPAVQLLSEDAETWPEELASMGPGDLLFVIATRPWPSMVPGLLEFAQTARVHIVVITDPASQAKVKRHGGIPLICQLPQNGAGASYTALMSMIALLQLATIDKLGNTALVRSDLIEGLREQLRTD